MIAAVRRQADAYRADYKTYYDAWATPDSPTLRDSNPSVVMIPGVGLFGFGKNKKEARITTEVLPPIDLSRELPAGLSEEERVERGHELVFTRLQRAVREMKHDEPQTFHSEAAPPPRAARSEARPRSPAPARPSAPEPLGCAPLSEEGSSAASRPT